MSEVGRRKEITEAINAGKDALFCLNRAKESLNSAGNWGLWDMFGGGMLSTFMKHSKMETANEYIQEARSALRRFQKEVTDVDAAVAEFHIETKDFMSFADFFFDGFIADWLVQSRIGDAKRQVDNAIQRVNYILEQLKRM